ncbi:MAG: 5'/3'-nucleotidase SurE [Planctomycetota bacterium]
MKILLTNDDGIYAPGLRALRRHLKEFADVTVVAPASEQSAAGHSITLLYPLIVQEIREQGDFVGFAVEGKPADCVKLGLVQLLPGMPDLVVSGINSGSNAGINVLYSGTVAAAIEAAFFKVPAIAVSLELPEDSHYDRAAAIAVKLIRQILEQDPQPGDLFNINIPELSKHDPVGIRVTEQGLDCYRESYELRTDPRGRHYYWLLPDRLRAGDTTETDLAALANRQVSITPLHFDLTAREKLRQMRDWQWKL